MQTSRRRFLTRLVWLTGLLSALPRQLFAAMRGPAFNTHEFDAAWYEIVGTAAVTPSEQIVIQMPDLAENGANVPITITSDLPGIETISVFVTQNPFPLVVQFHLYPQMRPHLSFQIKMDQTSEIIALVKAHGNLYSQHKQVRVVVGGCS